MLDRLLPAGDPRLAPSSDLRLARSAVESADVTAAAERHRRTILDLIDQHENALHRSCRPGHLTGSALVVSADGREVVMLHHRKLRRWMQPGGHCDGDGNLAGVALREAGEETGLRAARIDPVAIDVDVHRVDDRADGPHLHLDVRFLVVAPAAAPLAGNHESTALRWVAPDGLAALGVDAGTQRMVHHGLDVFGGVRG